MNNHLMIILVLQFLIAVWGRTIPVDSVANANEYPRYAFDYAVPDSLLGGNKAQWEERDGDLVSGAYSLLQPDENLRVVEYSADDLNGFSAIVKTLAARLGQHPVNDALPYPLPPINPLIDPHGYGFGAAPLGVGVSHVKVTGSSLPWDPKTGSFGGWVPIGRNGRKGKISYATIMSKRYVNGRLKKVVYAPIPLRHKSVILIKKKKLDD